MIKIRKYIVIFTIALFGDIIMIFVASYLRNLFLAKLFGGIGIVLTFLVTMIGYFVTKKYYEAMGKNGPLFIPKIMGVGFTINPYHFLGKCVWLGLQILLIVVFICFMLEI